MSDDNKLLQSIFKEQKDFQKYFYDPENLTDEDKIKFTKEYILSMHKELGEVLDTMSWKLHRKENKIKSDNNTVEEIIDCFKFLLNLCIIWKIDADKFAKEFFRKSMVVRQRYNQEVLNVIDKNEKVCAIDLDDTLAKSSDHFVKVYNEQNHIADDEHCFKTRVQLKEGIPILKYEKFKNYFRESGEKIKIEIKKGAKELCQSLKEKGYKIVIISARPYKKYNRIFPDTLEWLNNNGIKYDALYFEKDKHLKILEQIPNLSFIIEDNPDCAKQISEQGYKVFLIDNEHEDELEKITRNKLNTNNMITQINKLSDIIEKHNI